MGHSTEEDLRLLGETLWQWAQEHAAQHGAEGSEEYRVAFNEHRRAGWDRFARLCDRLEALGEKAAKKGAGR